MDLPDSMTFTELALQSAGILTCSKGPNGYAATMNWRGIDSVPGKPCDTIAGAMIALEAALLDDAADECEC